MIKLPNNIQIGELVLYNHYGTFYELTSIATARTNIAERCIILRPRYHSTGKAIAGGRPLLLYTATVTRATDKLLKTTNRLRQQLDDLSRVQLQFPSK